MNAPTLLSESALKQTPPKNLIVDLSMQYGGSTSRVLSMLSRFPRDQVLLAALRESAIAREAQNLGLPVHIVGNRKTDPRIVTRLAELIREHHIQVLDSQNIQSKFYASLASTWTRTALVSTINSWYANEHGGRSIKGWLYTLLELITNWNLSLYITVSQKDRQSLLRSGIRSENIELIYNAFEMKDLPAISDTWLHTRLGIPADRLLCTAVGRLVAIKGYDVLIEAAREACKKIPSLTCVIIGEGEAREELERQIEESGMKDHVILAGYFDRNEVTSALRCSHLFAMPSRYEGTPIALLEAAALGCPILASSTGGIPELVTNEEHALLVPPGDAAALAEGIIRLCKDRKLAKELAGNAQRRANKDFNFETQVTATLHAYQKAWSKHQRNNNGDQ
jgi:glycosyltransferase involved in cell wall biosynthesis